MKTKLFLIAMIICLSISLFAESTTYTPTIKVRAAILETNYNISTSFSNIYIFQKLNEAKNTLNGSTPYDVNLSFYNPRGGVSSASTNISVFTDPKDAAAYWILPTDSISLKTLSTYDVLYVPVGLNDNMSDTLATTVATWVQNGGVLWLDQVGTNGRINYLPYPDFGDVTGAITLNNESPIKDYPLSSTEFNSWTSDYARPLKFNTLHGMSIYPSAVTYSGTIGNALHHGVVKVGSGKIIYTSGDFGAASYSNSFDKYAKLVNLLYYAFAPDQNDTTLKRPSVLGDSLNSIADYYGTSPMVYSNMVVYTKGSKLYVDGYDLTSSDVGGSKPTADISKPVLMGTSDLLVYDTAGNLFLCTGLKFDSGGKLNKSAVKWLNLYQAGNACVNTIKYAPLVYNYWVYFVDDLSNLHCVYTKELDGDLAKYKWVTKGGSTVNSENITAPVMNSRVDLFGSYITEVSWITLNDKTAASFVYFLSTVPIAVINEMPKKQPVNIEPYNEVSANYYRFPALAGNQTFKFFANDKTSPDDVFVDVFTKVNGNIIYLKPYVNGETEWDYKVNKDAYGNDKYGAIQLNTKKTDNNYYFADDASLGKNTNTKNVLTQNLKFNMSYVPQYTDSLKSNVNFAQGIQKYQNLEYSNNGYIYLVDRNNNTDSLQNMTYVTKEAFTENSRTNVYSRYPRWSYLPHTGFKNTTGPISDSSKVPVYSYIDWGFPSYVGDSTLARVYVNGVTSYDNKVYISATAVMGNGDYTRSAIICLDSDAKPEIRIVDESRNNIELQYVQTDTLGNKKDVAHTIRISQPATYDTGISFVNRLYNVNASDKWTGVLTIDNMTSFNKDGQYQHITTSLPAYVQLEWTETGNAGDIVKKYIPVFSGTSTTMDENAYNNSLPYNNVIKVSNATANNVGTANIDKKVYADMSAWNQVLWYSVLPGNTELFGKPVLTGDKVVVFGYEKDEFGQNKQNKSFVITPKANITGGVKVREESIKSTNISNSLSLNDKLDVSYGTNKIAVNTAGSEISVFENSKTLMVDNNNIFEVDPSGNIVWRLNNIDYSIGGNNYSFAVENPVRVKYILDNNNIAIADASLKSIFVINKAGRLKSFNNNANWSFNSFVDKYGLLRAGQTIELGLISDFAFWAETIGSKNVYHFLVADSTNRRVLDLTFATDSSGNAVDCDVDSYGRIIPYLNWVSYDIIPDKKFNYTSIDITEKIKDSDGNVFRAIVTGIANYNASERNGIRLSKGGSVLIYDYRLTDSDYSVFNSDTYYKRFGRAFDGIGKNGDSIFDEDTSDSVKPYISGLKKVVIENLDGRSYDSGDIKPYTQLRLILCDEFGANAYSITSSSVTNGVLNYYWGYDSSKRVPAKYFGLNDPTADTAIVSLIPGVPPFMTARFKPFTASYYGRVGGSDVTYRTTFAPIKAPIIPVDLKVLPNGNWLVLNGYSGNLDFKYKNPYDKRVYEIKGRYTGEAIEFKFTTGFVLPEIVWSSNSFKSFAVDDYLSMPNYSSEELNNWNAVLDNFDGSVYSPDATSYGYNSNIIGGWKLNNKALQSPRSLDR